MLPNDRQVVAGAKTSGVSVVRNEPDFDYLAWTTLSKLIESDLIRGPDDRAGGFLRDHLRHNQNLGTLYVNPWAIVSADRPTREFLHTAMKERIAWYQRLRIRFFGSGRAFRAVSKYQHSQLPTDGEYRQLAYHGVLILDNKHVFPNRWPSPSSLSSFRSLIGCKFGKLTVLADLPRQLCRCLCECGKEIIVRRKHLRARRTKSCGCLSDARRAFHENRKLQRSWNHS